MNKSIYIPINSLNVSHYFNKGCIFPARYLSKRIEDVQTKFQEYILISSEKWVGNNDCSIEIILTQDEKSRLSGISQSFHVYNGAVPVSRIKSICFKQRTQMETTAWNINNGAAFIPKRILQVEEDINVGHISESELDGVVTNSKAVDLTKTIKFFDHLLGGLAFMRLGGQPTMNYSENYFSTLSFFNKLVSEQLNEVSRNKGIKFSEKYWGLFSSKEDTDWSTWRNVIFSHVDKSVVETIAATEKINVETRFNVIQLTSIPENSIVYDFALLATYGERKNKGIESLVTDMDSGVISKTKKEEIALLVGLNNGYSKFLNQYKSGNLTKPVKFKLESKLDYYTIESIYQFAFHGNRDNRDFHYLNGLYPEINKIEVEPSYETYRILDSTVILKKKHQFLSSEYLEDLFQKYSANEIYTSILSSLNKYLPPYLKMDTKLGSLHFETLLRSPLSVWLKAIFNQVKSDYEAALSIEKSNIHADLVESFELENIKLSKEIAELRELVNELKNEKPSSIEIIEEENLPEHIIDKGEGSQNNSEIANGKLNIEAFESNSSEKEDNYETLKIGELRNIAKLRKIPGYNKLKREELIVILKSNPSLIK